MQIDLFKTKLFTLINQNKISNEEIKYIGLFESDNELFNCLKTLSNDTIDFDFVNNSKKELYQNKKLAHSIWDKIINSKIGE